MQIIMQLFILYSKIYVKNLHISKKKAVPLH